MKKISIPLVLFLALVLAAGWFGSGLVTPPVRPGDVVVRADEPAAGRTAVQATVQAAAPTVVHTLPEPGQEQPLDRPIEITFNEPMDRASVEKAFAIEPGASVDGTFTWLDDRTVRFMPEAGFERGQRYRVRVVESGRSQAGVPLAETFEFRFSAVGTLEITNVQPAPGATEVLPDTIVTVLFNRPVVPLNAIEDAGRLPNPLTFVPPVQGTGEWLNTSIYRFIPDDGFAPATDYRARISAGLKDATGNAALEEDFEWAFTTVTPSVVGSLPANGDIYVSPTPVISLTFNQPMDRESVEQTFRLINDDTGESIPGRFSWSESGLTPPADRNQTYYDYTYDEGAGPTEVGVETVAFTPDIALDFGVIYRAELPAGTKGSTGLAETQNDFVARFTVSPYPKIASTYPADGAERVEPWQALQINFNAPMNPSSLVFGENLIIEPTVAATQVYTYWWDSNTQLEINFPTEASSQYEVTLGADIEGRYGQKLGAPTTIAWETRADSPMIYLHSPGRIATYNAYTETVAYVTVRNLNQVDFNLYSLPLDDFIRLNGQSWWDAWDRYRPDEDNLLRSWEIETTPELNDNVIYRVDLGLTGERGEILPPGLYYLETSASNDAVYPQARSAGFSGSRERQMLVVSKNNITLKSSNGEALAWVTDLISGQPVAEAPVTFIASSNEDALEPLGEAFTTGDGVAVVEYPSRENAYEVRLAFAGRLEENGALSDDFAVVVNNWTDGIDRYQFNNVTVEDYQQPYTSIFYTDRQIYRPGQTVYFKGILRADDDARYSLPTAEKTVQISVTDSQGKEIFSAEQPLSEFGTVNGSFDLAEAAALGYYSIEALYDEDNHFYGSFQVAAYRKPEFLVEVSADKDEYVQGEDIKVTAAAEFLFGGPVSNAAVKWTALSNDWSFTYQGDGFYDFTDYDFSRRYDISYGSFGGVIAEGEGTTDENGRFTFELPADIDDKIASQRFTIDVAITDLNNQEVAGQAEAIVHKGFVYVGLRPERYVGRVNQENQVNVLTVDWDSEPVANQEVQVVFSEHNWYSVQKQYEDGSFYWDSVVEDVPVMTTTVTSDRDGRANAVFTPENGGIYKIAATAIDRQGNEVRSSTYMWVSGSEYVNWRQENNDRIDLVADQREYEVGDTATILVPHPYSGTVKALVTLERGHIYDYYITELETNSEQLEVPITEEMIPNMYVSVVVVAPAEQGTADGLPSFKVGYASLPIDIKEKLLQISLTPNKPAGEAYQPGEAVEYQVDVTDVQGRPVEAELSLALVDKAVLALAPETPGQMKSTFWRNRGLGVSTAGSLTLAIDRVNLAVAPQAKGGGGGGFDEGFGVIRGEFKDTALWVGDLVTDARGRGVIETVLPDNLTTWTLTGKGVTGAGTLVGENTVEIVSTKPLLVRPVAPRFFVVGDEARLGMIVQNNTSQPQQVETRFEAAGLKVEPLSDGDLTIAPGERREVEYRVVVEDAQLAQLTMGAKSAEYGDALAFDLPIYRFSTPETVATAGVLEQDGIQVESISLPQSFDPSQGDLTVSVEPSLAAGMRDGLDYLEHFPYECTEQTVSRFLPNIFTYRAYQQLDLDQPELADKLPGLVSLGLQRLYRQQHVDGGWGWWTLDDSNPFLTAYVLLGLVEARQADFTVDQAVVDNAVEYLRASLTAPSDTMAPWKANTQAFILYTLAEAGSGDLGRSIALFGQRQQLDIFGRAYLAMAIHHLDPQASQVKPLLDDITSQAIVSATGAHWEEAQVDYNSMNTDTRSTAIVIAALSRIQPDHPLLPNAVRWLMSIRQNGGHWETTQENAWAIIGLTDWMAATGELEGNYAWRVSLNGNTLDEGQVNDQNIDQATKLRVEVGRLLTDAANQLAIERDPIGPAVDDSPGRLYYSAYLTYYKPVQEVKALDRGIIVSRQYFLQDAEGEDAGRPITEARVGDVIQVKLTLIAPNDLHYVVVEDPLPAGAEGIDTSLATTSVVGQEPELTRTDRSNPWGPGYGWWYFSHAELRDEKAALFATYLPSGTYEYTYSIRASIPGEFRVIPTHAAQMYFPEVFGRGDGGLFRITE